MAIHITNLNTALRARSDRTGDLHVTERRWFAVRTAAKREKMAQRELDGMGIENYAPMREKVCVYTRKTVTRRLPLLSGYVFVRVTRSEAAHVRRAYYVSRFVCPDGTPRQVREEEIQLLRALSADRNLEWETIEDVLVYEAGQPVEIISGPLAGVRGHYVDKKNKKTLVISLGGIGACLATCEVDPTILAPLKGETEGGNHPAQATKNEDKPLW